MKFTVRMLRRSVDDVEVIYEWLKSRSPAGAIRWYGAFLGASRSLQNNPQRFGIAPESVTIGREIRQRLFKTRRGRLYRLLYLIASNEVWILRVRGPGQASVELDDLNL